MAFSPTTSWQIEVGKVKALTDFFSWALKSLWMVTAAMNSKDPRSLKGNLWQTFCGLICFITSILKSRHTHTHTHKIKIKSRDITLPTKVHFVKAMVFPVVMYGCESWIIKKAEHQRIDVFELWCWRRLLRVPWAARRFPLVNPKGNQPWTFIWKTEAEAKAPILWPPDAKSCLIGKDPGARKDWKWKEKQGAEDETVW